MCRLSVLDDRGLMPYYFPGTNASLLISPVLVCPHCQMSSLESQAWCWSVLCYHYIISSVFWESGVHHDQSLPSCFLHKPCHLYLFSSPTCPYAAVLRNFSPFSEYATLKLCFPICYIFSWSALPSFLCMVNSHSCCKTQLKCHLLSENFLTPAKKNAIQESTGLL